MLGPRTFRKPSGLRSTTRRGDVPLPIRPVGGPLNNGVVRAELRVLSLSGEEGRSTFGGVVGILAKF